MDLTGHSPNAPGIAAATIVLNLIEALVTHKVLSGHQATQILQGARSDLQPRANIASIADALTIIEKMLASFPEGRV